MFNKSFKSYLSEGAAGAAIILALGGMAFASPTTNLAVSASVTDDCSIAAAPTLAFGTYGTFGTNGSVTDAQGTLSVTCTTGTVATIAMDAGANSAHGGSVTRALKSGTNYLPYELYSDEGHSTVWGTGLSSQTESAATNSSSVDYTVYGEIPATSNVPVGSYSDTVAITVSF